MLQRLNDQAVECFAHAEALEETAGKTDNPQSKADYLDLARRWRRLAESYQFVERVDNFLANIKLQRRPA